MSTTPAKATVARVASELSTVTGRSASAIANATGLSPSTARKCLATLREAGKARRHEDTADWFAVSATAESDDVVDRIDEAIATVVAPVSDSVTGEVERVPNPFPGPDADPDPALTPRPETVKAVLVSWGLSEKLAGQDAQLYVTLKQAGPLRRDELEARLTGFSEWSLRRLSTGKHQGRQVGEALIETVGRGEAKVYRVID